MTNYTTDHRLQLEAYLESHTLPKGVGNTESACTVAAINLAMSGRLTDAIPECMSEVLGRAAIGLQDAMPDKMRNGQRYKRLIPDMPGTGRAQEQEQERLEILMDWMWGVVLPQLQPIADKSGFGDKWRLMCHDRTAAAARAAARAAAYAAARAAAYAAAYAADAADAAVAAVAADAADAAADAAAYAATYAADAAVAADAAARAAYAAADARADFWAAVDPIGALERMTYLGGAKP